MAIIKKKCWPEWFERFCSGERTFELRLADFDLKSGDKLVFEEYNPKTKQYTGSRQFLSVKEWNILHRIPCNFIKLRT